jgi:hypothetical protein
MGQKSAQPSAISSPDRRLGDPQRSERRERRSPLSVLLRVCGFAATGRIFSELASTLNISPSGCCVRLRTQPLVRASLAVRVIPREGPGAEKGPPVLYEVAWLEQNGHFWDVGLRALSRRDLLQVAFASSAP